MDNSTLWLDILSAQPTLSWLLVGSVAGVALIMAIFVMLNGISRLEDGFSGKLIQRWPVKSVVIHWLTAVPCLILVLTGIIVGAAKVIFEPGSDAWAYSVHLASDLHEIAVFPFIFGAVIMIISWYREQAFKKHDVDWFKKAGGYINFGNKQHPDAGFSNGGEKLWFWVFTINFLALSITGLMLFFPQTSPSPSSAPAVITIHIIAAMIIGAFAVVHIFMATVISEGGLSNMISGKCDENWARQHHNLWYRTLNKDKQAGKSNG